MTRIQGPIGPIPSNEESIVGTVVGILILALVVIVVAYKPVVFLALTVYTAAVSLTWPAILNALATPTSLSLGTCTTLVCEGCLAGLVIGLIRKGLGFKSKAGETVVSKVISLRVYKRDCTFAPTLVLSLLVAAVIGVVASACGTVGISDLILGADHLDALGVFAGPSPLAAVVASGGAGGIGSGGGGLEWIIMIIIAFVLQGVIVGSLSGVTFGVLFGAVRGALKSGAVAGVVSLVSVDALTGRRAEVVWKSAKTGALEGAIVGGIVGLIQGVVTAIAFHAERWQS